MFGWRKNNDAADSAKKLNPSATADADLVRAARTGDKRAFVEIVARHQAMVVGVALGVLGDFAASEDAGQEAFLTAWRKLHELREPERLRSWLAQIARNAALGHLRRKRGHDDLNDALGVADESPLPDEVVANDEEAALVRESLIKLPENYRVPLILFYREGQSVAAVAETLNISEDAVKQRLARGREMLRDRMSGLVENVLTRTRPTAVFTMAIAVAIGALAAPAAIAAAAFTSAAATGVTSTASPLLTAMSTTKTALITAAVLAVACVPIGYHFQAGHSRFGVARAPSNVELISTNEIKTNSAPNFENSALFREWRQLHETYGNTPDAMPSIYKAIADIKDSFRRRAFRSALIAEWVQLDAPGGLKFFVAAKNDSSQRKQFFEEWLNVDAKTAVDTLMKSGPGWESLAHDALKEIATRVPSRVPEIVAHLPKPESYWDTKVSDAFAIIAEGTGLNSARAAAEAITGPNREQALAGVARTWAKTDLTSAVTWAKSLPDGVDLNEIIRAALTGKASSDPVAALDAVNLVPPGGRDGYFATTTGARVLSAAVKADYDATVAWLTQHPGKLGYEDMMGMANAVTERLNADPIAFLNRHSADGSLKALMPAIGSAILNDAGGQRATIWEWLKTQPENDATATLRREVMSSTGYQDPALAMKFVNDLPRNKEGDQQVQSLAMSIWNGGQALNLYDKLIGEAPERLREALLKTAFQFLPNFSSREAVFDAAAWVARVNQLPENDRAAATANIARAWSAQSPEAAIGWVSSLPAGEARSSAAANVVTSWASTDPSSAAAWVSAMSPGKERDASASSLAFAIDERYPQQAWDWALSIEGAQRETTLDQLVRRIGAHDPNTASQLVENSALPPEMKASLRDAVNRRATPTRR